MVPDAPTSVPATIRSVDCKTYPLAATVSPVNALSREITIGNLVVRNQHEIRGIIRGLSATGVDIGFVPRQHGFAPLEVASHSNGF